MGRDDVIMSALKQAGWQPAAEWSMRSALGWLLPRTPVGQLPVLPKYSQGEPSQLVVVRVEPDAPGSRLVLRLWPSHFKVRDANGKQPL